MFTEFAKVLVSNFLEMGNTVFFNKKSDVRLYFPWHGILCLLITGKSGLELSGDRKYCLFISKKLMGRLYLFYIFELLMTFQVFRPGLKALSRNKESHI